MNFGGDMQNLAFTIMVAIAVGGVALAVLFPMFANDTKNQRIKALANNKSSGGARRLQDEGKERRKQVQESLKQIEERERKRKKITLRTLIAQSGLDISVRQFWLFSLALGAGMALVPMIFGLPLYLSAGLAFVFSLGFPRWFLGFLRRRRQDIFLRDFADAIDVMVRGLKAGLPVSDAMKVIANETGPPVGPEFVEVVEGQRVGISIDQGIERMVERMPLAEVNFLAIVMAIQSKTGGNLSEALGNLSKVLRDRKKMKAKIKSVSQEAKSSAAIIGALPFFIALMMTFLNPTYLSPMFNTSIGNMLLIGCGVWMLMGVLVMRKMINFDF
ncbi:MAG TPA: type II secretion system F family protein [Aestuariivirga sp.]|nr:type II secretion system F family protein [Aestuariivirga sp.]